MRDYGKVSPKFWIGATGKALRKNGLEAQLVGLYLMTNPHANMLGLYYLPQAFIAHETGLGLQGATKGLQGCLEAGFCAYDEDSEMVWVFEMASFQIAERLEAKDNRCKGVQNEYNAVPENPYLSGFYDKYGALFHMTERRGNDKVVARPLKAPSKPLASQEQEQEQEQEQKQEQKTLVDRRGATPDPDPVVTIFEWWQKVMASPRSVLDDKRKKVIKGALKLYDPRHLCEAILGCAKSDFHMARGKYAGENKQNGVDLILRDAEHIDKFIAMNGKTTTGPETIEQRNERIMAELMAHDQGDPNTIDMEP